MSGLFWLFLSMFFLPLNEGSDVLEERTKSSFPLLQDVRMFEMMF
jgi:hypothetical protein